MNIREIAKRAGVSSATISWVLNNSGYVKEETRQKVLQAVKEYNYVPSAVARSLSIQDSLSIGAIMFLINFMFKILQRNILVAKLISMICLALIHI